MHANRGRNLSLANIACKVPYKFDNARFIAKAGNAAQKISAGHATGSIKIDASLEGWPTRPPERISGDRLSRGSDSGGVEATFKVCWDETNLYLLVNVTDPTPMKNELSGASLWCADGGIVTRVYFQKVLGHEFFLNGMEISFIATLASAIGYVLVSLLTCKKPHNMDKLLNRGEYAVEKESDINGTAAAAPKVSLLNRILGIDKNFSRSDRWITLGIFWWSITWFLVFVIGSAAYLIYPWSSGVWADFWFIQAICLPLGIGVITTIWFTIGCTYDLRAFFRRLTSEKINLQDDGTVAHDEEAGPKNAIPSTKTPE